MRKTQICRCCGKPIAFVRKKGAEKSTPVEPERLYFIPCPEGEEFYLTNGSQQTGHSASDGICGYREHICPNRLVRCVLNEKELARRRYY